MKILLIGNPNVGKSAIFSHLTGVRVTTSNYPGTTVSFSKGFMTFDGKRVEVIDVPGTYSLKPTCEAEKAAVDMIGEGDVLVNVVDSTNLERNLNLTLQLMELGKPMVIALNLWDEAKHKGIWIDFEKLSGILKIPVIPTNGVTAEGLKELQEHIFKAAHIPSASIPREKRWEEIGRIISEVQNLSHRHHTFMENLQDLTVHPYLGLPVAVAFLLIVFRVVIYGGEYLVGFLQGIFESKYTPVILRLSRLLGGEGILHALLIGNIADGGVDYEAAMGVLTTGIFVAFGLVLPYIVIFYIVLGFLEDLGYLPRVAVIFDRFLHKVGLHGYSILPMILAFGCNVPGVLAIRNLESRRERFITAVLTCITIPCMAQTALIVRAVGRFGSLYILLVITTLFLVWLSLGAFLKRFVKGNTPTLLMEVPPYRMPALKTQAVKLWMRLSCFIKEAIPYVLGGILLINLLEYVGVIDFIGRLLSPIITGIFGLPKEVVSALIIGIVRKDAAVALLDPIGLNAAQTVTAVMVLILYFPCVATFTILVKELGFSDMLKAAFLMTLTTVVTGAFINAFLGRVFGAAELILLEILLIIFVGWFLPAVFKKAGDGIDGTESKKPR